MVIPNNICPFDSILDLQQGLVGREGQDLGDCIDITVELLSLALHKAIAARKACRL